MQRISTRASPLSSESRESDTQTLTDECEQTQCRKNHCGLPATVSFLSFPQPSDSLLRQGAVFFWNQSVFASGPYQKKQYLFPSAFFFPEKELQPLGVLPAERKCPFRSCPSAITGIKGSPSSVLQTLMLPLVSTTAQLTCAGSNTSLPRKASRRSPVPNRSDRRVSRQIFPSRITVTGEPNSNRAALGQQKHSPERKSSSATTKTQEQGWQ